MPGLTPTLGLIGASYGFGQKKFGVELGPALLRKHGFPFLLEQFKYLVNDMGDLLQVKNLSKGQMYENLYQQTLNMVQTNDFNLMMGGDHSVSIATVSALLDVYPNLSVIWVDAHADMNTPQTSPSGNLHGMPLSHLMGLVSPDYIGDMNWFKTKLNPKKLAIIGVRDIDPGEQKIIQQLGIQTVSAYEVQQQGMKKTIHQVLQAIDPSGDSPLHLSFDIDSMDPQFAKATGLHVPNGLNIEHIRSLGHLLKHTNQLVSAEFVELNPLMATSAEEIKSSIYVITEIVSHLLSDTNSLTNQSVASRAMSWPALG